MKVNGWTGKCRTFLIAHIAYADEKDGLVDTESVCFVESILSKNGDMGIYAMPFGFFDYATGRSMSHPALFICAADLAQIHNVAELTGGNWSSYDETD